MAQKPYKFNIEYIEKFYSYGSEAKVVEFKPVYEDNKPKVPKHKREPVTVIHIDPVAFCGLMLAVVMLVVMLASLIQFGVLAEDHAVMEAYVTQLREENVLLKHKYNAYFDMDEVRDTATALGMIPVEEARIMTVHVDVPVRQPEPSWWDDMVWFLSGLFA